jgi:integrase
LGFSHFRCTFCCTFSSFVASFRVQKGQIFQRHGAWHLRYRVNGKQVCQKLTDYNDEYRTLRSVRPLADDLLQSVNQGTATTETLQQFIDNVYFPHVELNKRPSTAKGYRNLYNRHIASRVAGVRIRAFRTKDGQTLLNKIASQHDLTHLTLIHVKSFLSGVFTFAKRMGSLDGVNPMGSTEVPKGRQSESTAAYSTEQINTMVKTLKGVSRVAVIVAAYTGLSLAELRGLKWEDVTDDELTVKRTIWHRIEGPPKTTARQDAIPLLDIVRGALAEHHKHNPGTTWVFEGPLARPLDLATLGSKQIKKALNGSDTEWLGWHALRRGFATRLHEAGVQDRIIQALLRHSSLSVTMKHYVKATPKANREAINRIG